MKSALNQNSLFWIIGVLQPVSPEEIKCYLNLGIKNDTSLADINIIQKFCLDEANRGYLIRVARNPDMFSLTAKGNLSLPKKFRHSRDKERIYLLKEARRARFSESREESAVELDGVSSSMDTRLNIEGAEASKLGLVVPRCQSYWPRLSKQLLKTGLSQPSRDTSSFLFISYANLKQLALASETPTAELNLNFHSIGLILGISPRLISKIAFDTSRHYRSFPLKKKTGGERIIDSPRTFLKVIQQFLCDYCLSGLTVHESVESYRPKHSIITNAARHCNKDFVANLDIHNFFGSITSTAISLLLVRAGFNALSAYSISILCTKNGILPQGAPTSPAISNAFLFSFDSILSEECKKRDLMYSRYADDITISGENKENIKEIIETVKRTLVQYGLTINAAKTRIASKHGQQVVTGVVVNDAPRPPRKFRRRIRAMFHHASKSEDYFRGKINELHGYFNYLNSFSEIRKTKELEKYDAVLKNKK